MPDRTPVVAGRFYPDRPRELERDVMRLMGEPKPDSDPTILTMVPHAGYMASGPVAGQTLGRTNLAETLILLGPNHTGLGGMIAVWPQGKWLFPGGRLEVDISLAQALVDTSAMADFDLQAHIREHSLEVLLPMIHHIRPNATIVPVAVSMPDSHALLQLGRDLADIIQAEDRPVSLVVSSDMSHYLPHDQAKAQDKPALEKIKALDPQGLFDTVVSRRISMCGVLPMTAGLQAAVLLGAQKSTLVAAATSGDTLGDYSSVVSYAGFVIS